MTCCVLMAGAIAALLSLKRWVAGGAIAAADPRAWRYRLRTLASQWSRSPDDDRIIALSSR